MDAKKKISKQQKRIVLKLYDDGWTLKEIAEHTGIAIDLVRHAIVQALLKAA